MGEANRRGTFKQRKSEAIAKAIKRDIKNAFYCLAAALFLALMIWLTYWGMSKTIEIRERERLGGRYIGLEAITIGRAINDSK